MLPGAKGALYDKVRKCGFVAMVGDRSPELAGISAPVFGSVLNSVCEAMARLFHGGRRQAEALRHAMLRGGTQGTLVRQTSLHQQARAGVYPLRLPPQHTAQFTPDPVIELFMPGV